MLRLRFLLVAAVVAAAAMLAVKVQPSPPSLLLITIDTLRPDRLHCYGHPLNRTPNIDRLASEGMRFSRAYCDMPWTTGSMASVMTGQYSNEHGLRDPSSKIDPDIATLAQRLHERGLQTAAVIGSFPLDSVYGLDKGFESYDDNFTTASLYDPNRAPQKLGEALPEKFEDQAAFIAEKQKNDWYRPDEEVTNAAIQWIDHKRDGRPFFLWVHYFGPHDKLDITRNLVEQEPEVIQRYDGDVEAADRAVGRLIDHLRSTGLLDRTAVVLHADHGQNLGESDYVGHTLRLDEVAVRVPLIMRYPAAIPAGTVRRDIARNIDIFPTFLSLWNADPGDVPGRSLLPRPEDPTGQKVPADKQVAYFESYLPLYFFWPQTKVGLGTLLGPTLVRGVRTPGWKLLTAEFRGGCTWGSNPSRDGVGSWHVQDPRPLSAERCAELGVTDVFRSSMSGNYGIDAMPNPPDEIVQMLQAEMHKHDDSVEHGEKFELTPGQTEKLKSLGYLR